MDMKEPFTLFAPGAGKKRKASKRGSETGQQATTADGLKPGTDSTAIERLVKKAHSSIIIAQPAHAAGAQGQASEPARDALRSTAGAAALQEAQHAGTEPVMPDRAQGEASTSQPRSFRELGLSEWLEGVGWSIGVAS